MEGKRGRRSRGDRSGVLLVQNIERCAVAGGLGPRGCCLVSAVSV